MYLTIQLITGISFQVKSDDVSFLSVHITFVKTFKFLWQFQRDHSKKRSEGLQLESNGGSGTALFYFVSALANILTLLFPYIKLCPCLEGLLGHVAKKPKLTRPSFDNSFDSAAPVGGSAPSPVASQISNPSRLIRYIGGRDRGGRKNKVLKVPLLCLTMLKAACGTNLSLIDCHLHVNLGIWNCLQMPANQSSSGSPWTTFEDQVHLIFSSYLHFSHD